MLSNRHTHTYEHADSHAYRHSHQHQHAYEHSYRYFDHHPNQLNTPTLTNTNTPMRTETKIVVNAAIVADPAHWTLLEPPENTFQDVSPGSTFYSYIETAAAHGMLAGYPCGTPPAGPCIPPGNKPYFAPFSHATRAQISKIVYLAAHYR